MWDPLVVTNLAPHECERGSVIPHVMKISLTVLTKTNNLTILKLFEIFLYFRC